MRLVLKDFPLASHPQARAAHEAARCAGALGRYWPYHDRLFANQSHFERDDLLDFAEDVGLERAPFARCVDEHRFAAAVETDLSQARAIGVRATPSFLVNGRPVAGNLSVEEFRRLIDEALKDAR